MSKKRVNRKILDKETSLPSQVAFFLLLLLGLVALSAIPEAVITYKRPKDQKYQTRSSQFPSFIGLVSGILYSSCSGIFYSSCRISRGSNGCMALITRRHLLPQLLAAASNSYHDINEKLMCNKKKFYEKKRGTSHTSQKKYNPNISHTYILQKITIHMKKSQNACFDKPLFAKYLGERST